MTNRETFVAALAQALAPTLYDIADKPEDMGFPIYDTKEEVEDHLARQFDPASYWTARAAEIAEGLAGAFEAGSVDLSTFDYDKSVAAFMALRSDIEDA